MASPGAPITQEDPRRPGGGFREVLRGILEPADPLPALAGYSGPKLAVITPHGDQPQDLHNLVPDLPHKVVTGTSHWLQMDKPEELNRILDQFLADVER